MLHTLRQVVNDDQKWRNILRGLNRDFYHQTVTTKQIEDYLSQHTGRDLSAFFNQYLRDVRIPVLEYAYQGDKLRYRWANSVADFNMPVKAFINGKESMLEPTTNWKEMQGQKKNASFKLDPNYYVTARQAK